MADALSEPMDAKSTDAPDASNKKKQPKQTAKLRAVHETAMECWDYAYDSDKENIREAYADLKFIAGDQWPEAARRERESEGRPCLTINRLPQFAKQITGDIRLSKPSIKVVPVDDEGDPATAEVYEGLIRNIENAADGRAAYYMGMDSQVRAGIGHWRVKADYCSDDTLEQELKLEGIKNGVGVLWDPDASEQTRADAMFCFVPSDMTREKFVELYPDATVEDVPTTDQGTNKLWWFTTDSVRIAEYWMKEPIKRKLAVLADGRTMDVTDETDPEVSLILSMPQYVKKVVERDGFKIVQYTISGAEVLEGPNEWKGKFIPIVPVLGEEVFLEQRTVRYSAIRFAKDAQQLYNYWRTAETEFVALQPKAPFIGTETNFKMFAANWAEANRKTLPYLTYTPDERNGGQAPQRALPPVSSAGYMEGVQTAIDDLKATTGIYDASLGQQSNETSGKAILARQREGDTANFVYYDNFNRAVAHTGRILIDLIPHYYDTARIVRVVGQDGAEKFLKINSVHGPDGQPIIDPQTGMPITQFDMQAGRYDLVMDTGPSFASRRDEARDGMERLMQAAPQAGVMFMDLYAKSLDWPFADEIGERLKAMRPPDPSDPAAQQAAQQQQEITQRGAMAEVQDKEAGAKLKMAQAMKAEAEAHAALQPEPQQLSTDEMKGPIDHEIAHLEKEAKRLTALAAYYTAESTIANVMNPPQETPPDPIEGEIKHITARAGMTTAEAAHMKAQADLHAAKNPPGGKMAEAARADENSGVLKQLTEVIKSLSDSSAKHADATERLVKVSGAKTRVVRDKDGRALHAEKVLD